MKDEEVGQEGPPLAGEQGHEISLDLHGVPLAREPQTVREPAHVGVHDDPLVQPERVPQDHVRGLPTHPQQGCERLHRIGDLSPVALDHGAGHPEKALRLVPKEARRVDHLLQLGRARLREGRRVGKAAEEIRGDPVHPLVRALCREDRRNRELVGIPVVERRVRVWVLLPEEIEDPRRALRVPSPGLAGHQGSSRTRTRRNGRELGRGSPGSAGTSEARGPRSSSPTRAGSPAM